MKTYLITGAMGFVGSHWVENLLNNGDKIIAVDIKKNLSLNHILKNKNFLFHEISILRNKKKLSKLVEKSDIVLHLASIAEPERYLTTPQRVIEIAALAAIDIIDLCADYKKKIFFTSTSEVYGKNTKIPFSENDDRVLGSTQIKRWCYSTSKSLVEHYIEAVAFEKKLDFRIVRLFNIYGPRLENRVVTRFILNAIKNENLSLNNGGKQTRCFTYIDDCIRAFNLILNDDKCKNNIFNVGTDVEHSVEELAKKIIKISNSKSKIDIKSYNQQFGESYEDIERRVPCVKKIKNFTQWTAETNLDEGLKKTINYYKKN
jgi:UDP-glucose 4-epimerase